MSEPTNEFKNLYAGHGQKPKGSGQYLDAWYWYEQGIKAQWLFLHRAKDYKEAR